MKIKYNLEPLKNKENLNIFTRYINGFSKEEEVIELIDQIKVVEEDTDLTEEPDQPQKQKPNPQEESKSDSEIEIDQSVNPLEEKEETDNDKVDGLECTAEELEEEFEKAISGQKADLIAFAEKYGIDLENATKNEQRKLAITEWYNDKIN
jgi:hypothetical protein